MLAAVMDTWTGPGRSITLRACVQGAGWSGVDEGLRIKTGTTEADSTDLATLSGWDYSNGYAVDDEITNRQSDVYSVVEDGGWIDWTVAVPDGHTYFEIGLDLTSSGSRHLRDIALWQIELESTATTTPDPLAATADASFEVELAAAAPATLGDAPVHTPLAATANADLEINLAATGPATLGDAPTSPPLAATADADLEINLAADAPASRGTSSALAATADASFEVRLAAAGQPTLEDPPTILAGEDLATNLDEFFAVTLQVGNAGDSYTATNLPPGLTFNTSSRLISGTTTRAGAWMVTYTITGGGGAKTVDRFLLAVHPAGQPQYALLVDWDGDKSFSHPLTDAFGDLTKGGVRTTRGRNYASMIYGRSVAGTLEATLVNFDGDYDRFATSDLSGLLLPRRRIIFVLAADNVAYRLWTGFLDDAEKVERRGGDDVVRVRATDIIGDLARADAGVAYMATTTVPDAVRAVLDAAGIDDDDRGDIAGTTQIEDYFAPDAKALLHLRHLEETEAGFLLLTGAGKITFESVSGRITRMRSRQVQVTITDADTYTADDLLIIPPPKQHDPMKDIANIVTVRVRSWSPASETELWRLGETVELQPGDRVRFQVSTGGSSPGRDPVTGRYTSLRDIAVETWIEPVANTDYTANTQTGGGGTDRTSSVGIDFAGAGTSAMLAVENEHATDAIYVTLLKVRGQLLNEEEPLVLDLRDEDSIADYGPRPYTVASELLSSVIEAQTYGEYILTLYAQPTRKAEVAVEVSDQLDYAGTLELSDRVEYVSRAIGTDMYIESIGHVLRPGFRHDMRLTLSQAGAFDDVIILDTGPGLGIGILGA